MKKFIAIIMASTIAMGVLGGCSLFMTTTDESASSQAEDQELLKNAADIQSMTEEQQDMVEPADAILRCMVENNMDYDPHDPLFFWKSLYYFAGAYAQDYPESKYDPQTGELVLPRYTMRALGSVISSEYTDLPAVPSEMSANVVYNPDDDTYTLYTGDVGLAKTNITAYTDNGDGTFVITVELRGADDDKLIATGDFTIAKNDYANDIIDPPFIYTITALDYKEGE